MQNILQAKGWSVSRFVAQAVAALRKVKNREPLDECDVAIIGSSLTRTIQEHLGVEHGNRSNQSSASASKGVKRIKIVVGALTIKSIERV